MSGTFPSPIRQKIFDYVKNKYGIEPFYPDRGNSEICVLRCTDSKRTFAFFPGRNPNSQRQVDVMIVRLRSQSTVKEFTRQLGFYSSNKPSHFLYIALNGFVQPSDAFWCLDQSFMLNASSKDKLKYRQPKEWLIATTLKYYDVMHAFDESDEIDWIQSRGAKVGDTVFIYAPLPIMAIICKCKVIQTDIYRQYEALGDTKIMRIKLVRYYEPDEITSEVTREKYGIDMLEARNPRILPHFLSEDLKELDCDDGMAGLS